MAALQGTLKRPIVPEGDTPGKPKPKSRSTSTDGARKKLFCKIPVDKANGRPANRSSWTNEEIKALVQYICLYWPQAWNDKWPVTKDQKFWESCAGAINTSCNSNRTGMFISDIGFTEILNFVL